MSTCPNCGFESETVNQRLRRLFVAGRTERSATVNRRNPDASRNEFAVAMAAANAEDVIDPRSASPDFPRPVPTTDEPVVRLGPGGDYDRAWYGNNGVPTGQAGGGL